MVTVLDIQDQNVTWKICTTCAQVVLKSECKHRGEQELAVHDFKADHFDCPCKSTLMFFKTREDYKTFWKSCVA